MCRETGDRRGSYWVTHSDKLSETWYPLPHFFFMKAEITVEVPKGERNQGVLGKKEGSSGTGRGVQGSL